MAVILEAQLRPYVAVYEGKQTDVYATSLYDAKMRAINIFNPPPKKVHMISVVLDGDGRNAL